MKIEPNINTFSKKIKSNKYQRFSLWTEISADLETPITAYLKIVKKNSKNNFLLESVEGGSRRGRYSIIGIESDKIINCKKLTKQTLENLKKEINSLKTFTFGNLPAMVSSIVGYMNYDFIRLYEKLPKEKVDTIKIPYAIFMRTSLVAVFDNLKNTITVVNTVLGSKKINNKEIFNIYQKSKKKITSVINKLNQSLPSKKITKKTSKNEKILCNMTRKEYYKIVRSLKKYITAGDIIQVVPSLRFERKFYQNPFSLYRSLRKLNPSPFLFILNFKQFSIVGSSPEILVRLQDNEITIRPIAGTRKRGKNHNEDLKLSKELLSDPKEISEHLMLLDLGRNDVGRVSLKGSVKVTEKMVIENYSHVMHIVSNVKGTLNKKYHPLDVLAAGFPAGTVTGAPKIRAMEIINEVENVSRSFYAGAVGYFAHNGTFDTCITLRTGLIKNNKLYVQSGGGIVTDSNELNEYNEITNKAKAILNAAEDAINF